ncbi:MAG TPA: M67 family peptidase [Candidatus Omnitrophica bacterium]|nr:M67 family peptidase [Candidatus Omnitrophota bacterium]
MENLLLAEDIREKIIAHCLKGYPKEACGILAGQICRLAGGISKIELAYPLENISDSPAMCYEIDSKRQLEIQKELRAKKLDMVAIYHSHTESDAYPSKKDLELAYYPDSFYLIISLKNKADPQMRAFKIVDGNILKADIIG